MSLLRPIAPLPTAIRDDMPRAQNDPYAASCNPPRQAKRRRSDSIPTIDNSPPSPTIKALPAMKGVSKPARSAAPSSPIVDPTKVNADAVTSKRRGRKPNTSSRAAREAQRKMNHSIIEKARRTKINEALSTLRVLVPAQSKRSQDDDEDDYEVTDEGKSKKGEEKEFKLDVLVRTVSFLQELTEKVKILEQGSCSTCRKRSGGGQKRKRDIDEIDVSDDETRSDDGDLELPSGSDVHTSMRNAGHDVTLGPNTRLPPIASWLPHPAIDPSNVPFTPTQSPRIITSLNNDGQPINQLPSPPTSTTFRPSITALVPPILTLPSPRTSASIRSFVASTRPSTTSRSPPGSAKTSPILSPTRTAEDESAASVLLHISSSSYRSPSLSERSYSGECQHESTSGLHESTQPLTPSSMLGLGRGV